MSSSPQAPPRAIRARVLVAAALAAFSAVAGAGVSHANESESTLPAFAPSPPPVPRRARLRDAPSVDERPTAWACNVMTLVDEVDCTLSGRPIPNATDAPGWNEALAEDLGARLCERVARETPDFRFVTKVAAHCRARLAHVTPLCAGGTTRLVDDGDHFGAEHATCYGALLALVREVRTVGQSFAPCCSCLVEAGCTPSFRSCASDVARCHAPQPATGGGCAVARCEDTCRATALLAPAPPAAPPPTARTP